MLWIRSWNGPMKASLLIDATIGNLTCATTKLRGDLGSGTDGTAGPKGSSIMILILLPICVDGK